MSIEQMRYVQSSHVLKLFFRSFEVQHDLNNGLRLNVLYKNKIIELFLLKNKIRTFFIEKSI